MTLEDTGFNAVLAKREIDPRRTKLYRHTVHPLFGAIAFDRWKEGPDRFLSFATVQRASSSIYGPKVQWCAHFLSENVEGVKHAARFLGVTRVLGVTVAFSEDFPVQGYIANEAPVAMEDAERSATPLAWEPWEQWDTLSENLIIDWGDAPRSVAQWAYKDNKRVLTQLISPESHVVETLQGPLPVYENTVLRWHLTQERQGAAGRLAKEMKPLICEGCGLDGVAAFGPELSSRCMEAHHLSPVSAMPEGGRIVDPIKDFAILCATCHRLIHGLTRPDDLPTLRKLWAGKF